MDARVASAPPSSGLAVVLESEPSSRRDGVEQWLGPTFRAVSERRPAMLTGGERSRLVPAPLRPFFFYCSRVRVSLFDPRSNRFFASVLCICSFNSFSNPLSHFDPHTRSAMIPLLGYFGSLGVDRVVE